MSEPLYDFLEEADVPPFKLKALEDYERHLNSDEEYHEVAYDPDYLAYLRVAYGRALRNCWFRDFRGHERQIDRIFTYAGKADLTGPHQPSWRRGATDIRLEYSIQYFESMMPNWNENRDLIPFAGVGVNESAAYDMLCFHLHFVPKPLIVLWEHEPNAYYESNMVHFVARDFPEFMSLVFARSS
jgi:hypothetical protein